MSTKFFRLAIILSILYYTSTSIFAQHVSQCGHDHVVEQWWAQNPSMKAQYEETLMLRKKLKFI